MIEACGFFWGDGGFETGSESAVLSRFGLYQFEEWVFLGGVE